MIGDRSTRWNRRQHQVLDFNSLRGHNLFDENGNGNFRLVSHPKLGRCLQAKDVPAGTLILFAGKKLTTTDLGIKKKQSGYSSLNYILKCNDFFIDGSPPNQSDPNFNDFIASLINEVSGNMDPNTMYNCELGTLKVEDYNNLPDNPYTHSTEYWNYVEVMIDIGSEWSDLFVHYSWGNEPRNARTHNRPTYIAMHPEGRLHPNFGAHIFRACNNPYQATNKPLYHYLNDIYNEETKTKFNIQSNRRVLCSDKTAETKIMEILAREVQTKEDTISNGIDKIDNLSQYHPEVVRITSNYLEKFRTKRKREENFNISNSSIMRTHKRNPEILSKMKKTVEKKNRSKEKNKKQLQLARAKKKKKISE